MGPLRANPRTASLAPSTNRSSLRRSERTCHVKNRWREFCTSGAVRGGGRMAPAYSAAALDHATIEVQIVEAMLGIRDQCALERAQLGQEVFAGFVRLVPEHGQRVVAVQLDVAVRISTRQNADQFAASAAQLSGRHSWTPFARRNGTRTRERHRIAFESEGRCAVLLSLP